MKENHKHIFRKQWEDAVKIRIYKDGGIYPIDRIYVQRGTYIPMRRGDEIFSEQLIPEATMRWIAANPMPNELPYGTVEDRIGYLFNRVAVLEAALAEKGITL